MSATGGPASTSPAIMVREGQPATARQRCAGQRTRTARSVLSGGTSGHTPSAEIEPASDIRGSASPADRRAQAGRPGQDARRARGVPRLSWSPITGCHASCPRLGGSHGKTGVPGRVPASRRGSRRGRTQGYRCCPRSRGQQSDDLHLAAPGADRPGPRRGSVVSRARRAGRGEAADPRAGSRAPDPSAGLRAPRGAQ
jgi:hypothetical protein